MRALAIVLLVAALGVAASATAAPVKPWIEANGSWATYSMGDVNDFVGGLNASFAADGIPMRLDEINNGFGFGVRFGLDLPIGIAVGAAYDRLSASKDVSLAGLTLEHSLPANSFRAFAEYGLPMQGPVGLRLGVSGGMISESGKLEASALGESEAFKFTGSGPLFEGYLSSTVWAAPQFGVSASLGYRYAKVGEVKAEFQGVTETFLNADGSKFTTDYSGVFVRLGLKVAFMK